MDILGLYERRENPERSNTHPWHLTYGGGIRPFPNDVFPPTVPLVPDPCHRQTSSSNTPWVTQRTRLARGSSNARTDLMPTCGIHCMIHDPKKARHPTPDSVQLTLLDVLLHALRVFIFKSTHVPHPPADLLDLFGGASDLESASSGLGVAAWRAGMRCKLDSPEHWRRGNGKRTIILLYNQGLHEGDRAVANDQTMALGKFHMRRMHSTPNENLATIRSGPRTRCG